MATTLPQPSLNVASLNVTVGGLSLTLAGTTRADLEQVRTLWSQLFVLDTEPPAHTSLELTFQNDAFKAEPGQLVYEGGVLRVTRGESSFDLACGASRLRVLPLENQGSCYLAADFFDYSLYEQREFFLLGLLMLLRPHGLYGLHACGLESGGMGLLVIGHSGAGKTTTCLNLIERGWRYLSDDAVLLRKTTDPADSSVEALAFRKGFSCTPETLSQFPRLAGSYECGDPEGKRIVQLSEDYGGGFTPTCKPNLLIFPKRADARRTSLEPLWPVHALLRLSQQSGGIMTDTAVSQGQLELLKRLTQQSTSFELNLASDALAKPGLVDDLVRALCW